LFELLRTSLLTTSLIISAQNYYLIVNESLIRELLRCEFIDKDENVLLIGNSGTGKTHLATALGFAACCQGYKVRFFGYTALVTQLLESSKVTI